MCVTERLHGSCLARGACRTPSKYETHLPHLFTGLRRKARQRPQQQRADVYHPVCGAVHGGDADCSKDVAKEQRAVGLFVRHSPRGHVLVLVPESLILSALSAFLFPNPFFASTALLITFFVFTHSEPLCRSRYERAVRILSPVLHYTRVSGSAFRISRLLAGSVTRPDVLASAVYNLFKYQDCHDLVLVSPFCAARPLRAAQPLCRLPWPRSAARCAFRSRRDAPYLHA